MRNSAIAERFKIPEEEIIEIVAEQLGRKPHQFNFLSNIREWHGTPQDVYKILEKIEEKYHIIWDDALKDKLANRDDLVISDIYVAQQYALTDYRRCRSK